MVGYAPERQWGHLTSGGSVANLEALWVARNVRYLPVALRWAAEEAGLAQLQVVGARGQRAPLQALSLWELLNVAPAHALDLADAFRAAVGDGARAAALLQRHSLGGLGYQEFGSRLAQQFRDALPPAVVLVPSTAHYSWEKVCRVLGIGSGQLVKVPVDGHFRMSLDALEDTLGRLAARQQPVLACVSVVGTTEEGAVDRLDRVAQLRERVGRELGLAFALHADAAWGGYAAAITRDAQGARRSHEDALADAAPEAWPDEGVYRALVALEQTDSVTIDPHKLGFIPYPAGAVSFRDRRVRELVAVEAPYVFHGAAGVDAGARGDEAAGLGRYIVEGSKPGAAAAAVWMSHQVLPLDASGYGRLVTDTARGARALHRRLATGDWAPFRVLPLPASDLNIVCFALAHPQLRTLEDVNAFTARVHGALSAGGGRSARRLDFFVTRTTLRAEEYGGAVEPLLLELGFGARDFERAGGLAVLRCTIMDPFLAQRRGRVDFIQAFAQTLSATLHAQLPAR
nr:MULTISPECIES: pyridoxal-dependent decarboxylase [Myxococcaceae]